MELIEKTFVIFGLFLFSPSLIHYLLSIKTKRHWLWFYYKT